jgi:hypothetical protein
MRLLLTLRRRPGFRLIEYLDDNGRSVVRTPADFWRRRKRREVGGPVPKPFRISRANIKALRALRRQSLLENGNE